jgi:hypothetical protein
MEQPLLLPSGSKAIVNSLLYYGVFNFPLTLSELLVNTNYNWQSEAELQHTLNILVEQQLISEHEGHYFPYSKHQTIANRQTITQGTETYYAKAQKYSKLISHFPFVEGVLITGSLSKGCIAKDGDIDYLIITRPGRLWICRGLLVLFKKVFLFNSRKYFCVNYYVDSESLTIPDRNIFTATEVISAMPAYNNQICQQFIADNNWLKKYYPNKEVNNKMNIDGLNNSAFKIYSEKLLGGQLGEKLDEVFMRLFIWRWKQKFKGTDISRFEVNFRSRKNVSKHHPNGFQFIVLDAYHKSIAEFEDNYNIKLR